MKKILLLSILSLTVLACGKDKSNDPIRNTRVAFKDRDLQNRTFESSCMLKPIDAIVSGLFSGGEGSFKSARTQYLFEGANITRTTLLYTDTKCAEHAATFRERGIFDVNKDQKTNDGGYFMDINYTSLHLEPKSEEGVKIANEMGLCGAKNWEVDSEHEVTANAKDMTCYGATVPRKLANLYRVDAKTLYLGTSTKDSAGPNDRPTKLNMSDKYVSSK